MIPPGPVLPIFWGFHIIGFGSQSFVEGLVRFDSEPAMETTWHSAGNSTISFAVQPFVQKALEHETVYIRIGANGGVGGRFYGKFELDGLREIIAADGGDKCGVQGGQMTNG